MKNEFEKWYMQQVDNALQVGKKIRRHQHRVPFISNQAIASEMARRILQSYIL